MQMSLSMRSKRVPSDVARAMHCAPSRLTRVTSRTLKELLRSQALSGADAPCSIPFFTGEERCAA